MSLSESNSDEDVSIDVDTETYANTSKSGKITGKNTQRKEEENNSEKEISEKSESDSEKTEGELSNESTEKDLTDLEETESSDSEEEEEEEEEKVEEEAQIIDPNFDFVHPSPVIKYQYRSISASLIRVINLYRNSIKLDNIIEDTVLTRIAMKHSLKMANDKEKFSSAPIKSAIASQPFAFSFAHVSRMNTSNHAFIDVANEWTTKKSILSAVTSKANSIGVGMATSSKQQSFFTVIIALRTYIGDASLMGEELRSVILSMKCLELVNKIRSKYELMPYVYDRYLSNLAYKLCSVSPDKITQKFIESRLPSYSAAHADLGRISTEDANPYTIVEEWMKQTQNVEAILGNYNRIGIGFIERKGYFYSVRVEIRSLHAAIVDGSEVLVDNTIIAKHVAEEMNEFRSQHSLQPLNLDEDLFKVAQEHSEYIANGCIGEDPVDSYYYTEVIEPRYKVIDISHTTCKEMAHAPKEIMKKWRNNTDCVSVLLNYVDEIGVGLCFDENYICHVTTIIANTGEKNEIVNKIVNL